MASRGAEYQLQSGKQFFDDTVEFDGIIHVDNKFLLSASEDLAHEGEASLTKTASYFTTGGAETATLAAGVDGQIKIFHAHGINTSMTITVSEAGWKASGTGTLTFNARGDGCTLIFTGGKWCSIGNNSVTAA